MISAASFRAKKRPCNADACISNQGSDPREGSLRDLHYDQVLLLPPARSVCQALEDAQIAICEEDPLPPNTLDAQPEREAPNLHHAALHLDHGQVVSASQCQVSYRKERRGGGGCGGHQRGKKHLEGRHALKATHCTQTQKSRQF